jgi:hypothetical protein
MDGVRDMQPNQYICLLLASVSLWVSGACAQEQLEQDTILIKGNQGLPSTLYIAPWKQVGSPLESTPLDGDVGKETEPVERDIFRRELELQKQGYSVE